MAFKMKAGKEGPMKKNFPSAFKNEKGFKPKGEITVKHNPNAKYGFTSPSSKMVPKTIIKPGGGEYSTWQKIGKGAAKIGKGIAKIGGKALMGGIIDFTNTKDPRVTHSLTKPAPKGGA